MEEKIGKHYHFLGSIYDEYVKIVGITNGCYNIEVYYMDCLCFFKDKRTECLINRFWESENFEEISSEKYREIIDKFHTTQIHKFYFI